MHRLPAISPHPSGQACCKIRTPEGKRVTVYLGKWAGVVTPAMELARAAAIARIQAGATGAGNSLARFWVDWLAWAQRYHSAPVLDDYTRAFAHLLRIAGSRPLESIGISDLLAVQDDLVQAGRTRQGVNGTMRRIKTIFRSGASLGLVPGPVAATLAHLRPLNRAKTAAPESPPLLPLSRDEMTRLVAALHQPVADMVRVQWETACRPAEICRMTWGEIDTNAPVWIYSPKDHKTAHHGHRRTIAIGSEAQAILEKYRGLDPIFSPARVAMCRMICPRELYDTRTYTRAISRAGDRIGVDASANRIRKGRLTECAMVLDEVAAARLAGHRSATVTERHYLGLDERARVVATVEQLQKKLPQPHPCDQGSPLGEREIT